MEINVGQILLQILNFGIIFFVLTKFLYKPILKILDERANKINEGLKAAEKSIKEQTEIEERKRQELLEAQKEAAKVLDAARKDAENLKAEILAQARKDATEVVAKEQAALEARMAQQEAQLKDSIGELVASSTRAVLQNALSEAEQRKIIASQIKQLQTAKVN